MDDDIDLTGLSDDPAILKQMLVMLWKRWRQTDARLKSLEAERQRPPRRGPEEDARQQYLFDLLAGGPADSGPQEEPEDDPEEPPPAGGGGGRRKRGKRKPLPPELPRVVERHEIPPEDPERSCSCCGGLMDEIGVRRTEQLDFQPATLVVREHHQVLYGCRRKRCDVHLARAPKPAQPIERGLPGPGLLAQVIVSRFDDHLPYYRQAQIFQRQGVSVSRRSMSRWMYFAAELLEPIVDHMGQMILRSRRIHTDDTTFPILEPGRGQTRAAKLWGYSGDEGHPHTIYKVTARRTRDGPREFLADYRGALQADAFSGYDCVYASGRVVEVACWAHAKRKFEAALEHDVRAGEVLALITAMYAVEARARGLPEAERCELRRREVAPLLGSIRQRCDELSATVRPKSALAAALTYFNNQRKALERFAETGNLEPDNNLAERALRGLALGRRNWLFAGTLEAAEKAAVLLSLVESCARSEVNTFVYLRDVLSRVSTHPHSRIGELTPAGWRAAQDRDERVA